MQKLKYKQWLNNGDLRHRITFQKYSDIQDDYGEIVKKDWIDVITVRASINPITAKEFFAAEKTNSEVSHKINMRYIRSHKITPDMRIKFGERFFQLIGPPINFQERNVEVQLLCKELF